MEKSMNVNAFIDFSIKIHIGFRIDHKRNQYEVYMF